MTIVFRYAIDEVMRLYECLCFLEDFAIIALILLYP